MSHEQVSCCSSGGLHNFVFSLVLIPFANADWIMFRSDSSHSGAGTGNPALTSTLLWNYTTGASVVSSSVVANGVVYVGSDDNSTYVLNATNGAKLWNYPAGGGSGSPAVVGGVVYIGSDDGNVYALGGSLTSTPTHSNNCASDDG